MYFAHLIVGGNDVDKSGIPLRFLQTVVLVTSNWAEQQQVLGNLDLEYLWMKIQVSQ